MPIELEDNSSSDRIPDKKQKTRTPLLDNFGKDLTRLAEEGKLEQVIGRDKEIDRVIQILSRKKKNNPILVGEPGCVLPSTKIIVRKISDEDNHRIIES